jgi:hypothetical protein
MKENPIIRYARETFVQKAEGKLLDNYDVLKQLGKGGYVKSTKFVVKKQEKFVRVNIYPN